MNPMMRIDGYKLDHRRQYPENTEFVYSNWTPRMSRVDGQNTVMFFGLQYFLQKYMIDDINNDFFNKPIEEVAVKYARRVNGYLGPNAIGTDHIRALHALGYLPLEFRAVPEGTCVPLRIPMLTVENTHKDFAWLVNYFETSMSNVMWLPCTSATTSYGIRKVLENAAARTGSPLEFVDWQGHDFSFRGMSGMEAAMLSGAGHLLNFTGTDTIPAIDFIEEYYGFDDGLPENYLIGGSVAATEHSVMCAGSRDGELKTFNRILDLYPSGIVSVVSDTWDLWNVLTNILPQLKDRIMSRDGKLVIRPDSGDPADIICGDLTAPVGSPAYKGVIELLWEIFDGTVTETGHRLLDRHIGCIYGDSISKARATKIMQRLAVKGFASANMVFGIGSYTYQYVTRDTFGFAMKATWCQINGVGYDIYKTPITDNGVKNSARGRLAVIKDNDGNLSLFEGLTREAADAVSILRLVWRNGKFLVRESFDKLRARAKAA